MSEEGADSEVPSTQREAGLSADSAPSSKAKASPISTARPPAGEPIEHTVKAATSESLRPPKPGPAKPAADEQTVAPADPTVPEAKSPLREAGKIQKGRRPPLLLIALTILLVVAAVAAFALRSRG